MRTTASRPVWLPPGCCRRAAAITLTAPRQARRQVDDASAAGAAAGEWITHGRDYAETHHSPLTQIDPGQRRAAAAGLVGRGRLARQDRNDADRLQRRALRHVDLERRLRGRRAHRRAQVALGSGAGAGRLRRRRLALLLRPGQPRRRALQGQGLRRPARRPPGGARRRHRPRGVGGADHAGRQRLQHHRRAAHRQGQGRHRQRRRRVRRARLPHRLRRRHGQAGVALVRRARRSGQGARRPLHGDGAQDLEGRVVEVRRRRHAVGRHRLRPGRESALRRHRQRLAVGPRPSQPRRRRQPVPLVDRRAQRRHRPLRVALPDHAGRRLGLQRRAADDPGRPRPSAAVRAR